MQVFGVLVLLVYGGFITAGIVYFLLRYLGIPADGITVALASIFVVSVFYVATLDKFERLLSRITSAVGSALGYLLVIFFIIGIPLIIYLFVPQVPLSTHGLLVIIIVLLLAILHELQKRNR